MKILDKKTIHAMSEADWQHRLDALSYHVLRQQGTERAFTGAYTDTTLAGVYRCKGCHTPLFDSRAKFHSGCGWPSFDAVIADGAVDERLDLSHGMQRTEVVCHHCGGHLGHVFDDNVVTDTGLRYCINSAALLLDANDKAGV